MHPALPQGVLHKEKKQSMMHKASATWSKSVRTLASARNMLRLSIDFEHMDQVDRILKSQEQDLQTLRHANLRLRNDVEQAHSVINGLRYQLQCLGGDADQVSIDRNTFDKSSRGSLMSLRDAPTAAKMPSHGKVHIDKTESLLEVPQVEKSHVIRKFIWDVCFERPFFDDVLELPYKKTLTDPFRLVEVKKGEKVFRQGDKAETFYVVETGTLRAFSEQQNKEDDEDKEKLSVDVATFGEIHPIFGEFVDMLSETDSFGEMALTCDSERTSTVVAMEDCRLWAIDRAQWAGALQAVHKTKVSSRIKFLRNVKVQPLLPGDPEEYSLDDLLSDHELGRIALALEVEAVAASTVIIRQGQPGDHFFIVESGTVVVTNDDDDTGENLLGPGGYFGARALMVEDQRESTIKAATECILLTLTRSAFVHLVGPLGDRAGGRLTLRAQNSLNFGNDRKRRGSKQHKRARRSSWLNMAGRRESTERERRSSSSLMPSEVTPTERERRPSGKRMSSKLIKTLPEATREKFETLCVVGSIGPGSFGDFHLVADKDDITAKGTVAQDAKVFACKVESKKSILEMKMTTHVSTECAVLAAASECPFIQDIYGATQTSSFVYYLEEYVPGGDLHTHLKTVGCFSEPTLRFFGAQLISALEYLHNLDVVYRDLKTENIVLDQMGYVKLVDFSLAKVLSVDTLRTWTFCGVPEYAAPELVRGQGHAHAVDLWQLGVALFELGHGHGPFLHHDMMALFAAIVRMHPPYPRTFSSHFQDLLSSFLTTERRRLGTSADKFNAVRKHFWFSGFDWDALGKKELSAPMKPTMGKLFDLIVDSNTSSDDIPRPRPLLDDDNDDEPTSWEADFGATVIVATG